MSKNGGRGASVSVSAVIRNRKVEKIFSKFDANGDSRLNRQEMADLVTAVNPRVKFTEEQINAILDEVFRTYGEFIDGEKGLSYEGLVRTYDDGAGDVDRDFVALELQLDDDGGARVQPAYSIMDERPEVAPSMRKRPEVGAWATSPNNGIAFEETWVLIQDLDIMLKRLERAGSKKVGDSGNLGSSRAVPASQEEGPRSVEQNPGYVPFKDELGNLRRRAESARPPEEAFDSHMAIGRVLYDHKIFLEAFISFQKAIDLKPADLRPHFRAGNALYALGKYPEARVEYQKALDAGQAIGQESSLLLPQVRVNLGIALEAEGMLLSACEQYREAAILNPKHCRALKHLGSALLGVGEYRAAQKALENAVYIKHDYADAHCDLGSVLHALKEHNKAEEEFNITINLQPDHTEALYNLGGLFRDTGEYGLAANMYAKVLAINPRHWQAQLNRAVALLGKGEEEDARRALKEAFKMTNRVELYDELQRQKHAKKKPKGFASIFSNVGQDTPGSQSPNPLTESFVVVEPSKFRVFNREKTTERVVLAIALEIRSIQKHSRLHLIDVSVLRSVISDGNVPLAPAPSYEEKVIRKSDLERVLRQEVLRSLNADAFQGAVKVINERVLGVLDISRTERVDLGFFFAILAPICAGSADNRKRAVFEALLWRTPKTLPGEIPKKDLKRYISLLRAVYLPSQGESTLLEEIMEEEQANISYPEFLEVFDDPDWGFGILTTLLRLEATDKGRHRRTPCAVCFYTIVGLRFKEVTADFNLCSLCYSEGKVPSSCKQDEFCFKEYSA